MAFDRLGPQAERIGAPKWIRPGGKPEYAAPVPADQLLRQAVADPSGARGPLLSPDEPAGYQSVGRPPSSG